MANSLGRSAILSLSRHRLAFVGSSRKASKHHWQIEDIASLLCTNHHRPCQGPPYAEKQGQVKDWSLYRYQNMTIFLPRSYQLVMTHAAFGHTFPCSTGSRGYSHHGCRTWHV